MNVIDSDIITNVFKLDTFLTHYQKLNDIHSVDMATKKSRYGQNFCF